MFAYSIIKAIAPMLLKFRTLGCRKHANTLWLRVFEKLIVAQLTRTFTTFHWTRHLTLSKSQLNPNYLILTLILSSYKQKFTQNFDGGNVWKTVTWKTKKRITVSWRWEVDGTGSGSCPVADFSAISVDNPLIPHPQLIFVRNETLFVLGRPNNF